MEADIAEPDTVETDAGKSGTMESDVVGGGAI